MAFFLGIDGGGSKTTCVVGDDKTVLATATTGPCNITRVGQARARESLQQAIDQACSAAGIRSEQVHRACAGVAGAGRDEIVRAVREIVAAIISCPVEILGDMEIAMEAAFGSGPGVIVVAGTGSIAHGRNSQGQTARSGGWGFAISDEGSAHWIGREAVAALLRSLDETSAGNEGIEHIAEGSPMFRGLKDTWKVSSLDQFLRCSNSHPDFSALFPAIVAASNVGDAIAAGVLARAGAELAALAEIVIQKIFAGEKAQLATVGGVFRHSPAVRDSFIRRLHELSPNAEVLPEIVDPVLGALQRARRPAK